MELTLLQVFRQRKSLPPPSRTRIFKSYWVLLDRGYHKTRITLLAYLIFRVVLLTWDALSRVANYGATGQPLQTVQDFESCKCMLTVLRLLLKVFEVSLFGV